MPLATPARRIGVARSVELAAPAVAGDLGETVSSAQAFIDIPGSASRRKLMIWRKHFDQLEAKPELADT